MGNFWVIWDHFNVCPQKHQSSLIFVFYHDHHRWHQPGEVEWDVLVGFEVLALASSVLYHEPLLGGAPSYFAGVVKKTTTKTKQRQWQWQWQIHWRAVFCRYAFLFAGDSLSISCFALQVAASTILGVTFAFLTYVCYPLEYLQSIIHSALCHCIV